MEINIPKGTYIVAVSGGVDSMTLLYLIHELKLDDSEFIVAHFNHGIRSDSKVDEDLAREVSNKYGYGFELGKAKLGKDASEDDARDKRLAFLMGLKGKYSADKIITAHHNDDLIETALINVLRGTNRRGLSSLVNSKDFIRPLIKYSKKDILSFAIEHGINWHEDSTNSEEKYLRNYLRHNVMKNMSEDQKNKILRMIELQKDLNDKIDDLLSSVLENNKLNRLFLSQIEFKLVKEVVLAWIRKNGIYNYDKSTVDRISVGVLTSPKGKNIDINKNRRIKITEEYLEII